MSIKGTQVTNISKLKEVIDLDCSSCNIKSIPSLPKLKNLVYKRDAGDILSLVDIGYLPELRKLDLSLQNQIEIIPRFPKLREAILKQTGIKDVSNLSHLKSLNIAGTNVSNVSMLKNLYSLNLRGTNVSDVSALGNLHYLNISYTNVEDVSALGRVHTLINLNPDGPKLKGLDKLNNNYKIVLYSDYISKLSLENVRCYELHIPDVSRAPKEITKVHEINLFRRDANLED